MDVLKKCYKAEIFKGEKVLCEVEVFRDLASDVWLSIPKDFPLDTSKDYTILFYDSIAGLVRCRCALGDIQPLSDEWDSVPCEILEVLESQQRRMDLKITLDTSLDLRCNFIPGPRAGIPEWIHAVTRDISAGGVYFMCEYELPAGSVVQFQLHGASKPLMLSAKVLRTDTIEKKDGTQYGHGCQFIDLKPQTEAVLRNYIFRQERQRRF